LTSMSVGPCRRRTHLPKLDHRIYGLPTPYGSYTDDDSAFEHRYELPSYDAGPQLSSHQQ
jgi:hypothetical protein